MASKAVKRKPGTADTGKTTEKKMETTTTTSESVSAAEEPLLANDPPQESKPKRYEPTFRPSFWDGKKTECLRWMHLLSAFISQSARKIGNVISEFGSLLSRLISCSCASQGSQNGQPVLVDTVSALQVRCHLQEERLRCVKQRLDVPYDSSSVIHQDALKELWRLAYPSRELPPLKSELWKEMGWQNSDPATDFRAGGFMSLENLIYFAKHYPDSFQRLLNKEDGKRSQWEYPFAVAGVNISYMLVQMLDLRSGNSNTEASSCFLRLLQEDEMAFDNLFCMAFQILDAQWLARRASYMEFNEVLKSTRVQLEQELTIGRVTNVQEMPSFGLLKR